MTDPNADSPKTADSKDKTAAEKTAGSKPAKTVEKTSSPASKAADKARASDHGKTSKPATSKKPARKPAGKSGHGATLLASLALLGTLAVAAGGYTLWQNQQGMQGRLDARLASISSQLDSRLDSQEKQLETVRNRFTRRMEQQMKGLQAEQKALSDSLAEIINKSHYLREDWLLAEAEYLVNLAGQRLSLMRDVKTAIVALQSADARLQDTGNPAMIKLRKALADDISQLRAIDLPDITGLSLQLSAISGQVNELRLSTPTPESVPHLSKETSKTVAVKSWKELPAAMWDDMKKLIVIRDHRGPVKPLLSPEQHFFLVQNLKLQLEQARLALLNGEQSLYRDRLAQAKRWIDNWFDAEDPLTGKLKAEIDKLLAVDIHPALPDLQHSFNAFEAFHAEQLLDRKMRQPNRRPAATPAKIPPTEPAKPDTPANTPAESRTPS